MPSDRRIRNAWIVWALEAIMSLICSVTDKVPHIKTPRILIVVTRRCTERVPLAAVIAVLAAKTPPCLTYGAIWSRSNYVDTWKLQNDYINNQIQTGCSDRLFFQRGGSKYEASSLLRTYEFLISCHKFRT